MFNIIESIGVIKNFLSVLSWKKIAQFSLFLLIIFFAWAFYENRESIYHYASQDRISRSIPTNKELHHRTQQEINDYVVRSDKIVGIQITVVDFQKNVRTIIYSYSDNKELSNIWKAFQESSISDIPLFTGDSVNNKRISDLINGDFSCYPYKDTILYRLTPSTEPYITTVCANGIPPFYGKFTGIISIYVNQPLSPEETDQIRVLAKKLSTTIYERDF